MERFYEWNEIYRRKIQGFQMHISMTFIQERRIKRRAGGALIELRGMENYKKTKNRYQICLLSSNAEFKNININYRKPF